MQYTGDGVATQMRPRQGAEETDGGSKQIVLAIDGSRTEREAAAVGHDCYTGLWVELVGVVAVTQDADSERRPH